MASTKGQQSDAGFVSTLTGQTGELREDGVVLILGNAAARVVHGDLQRGAEPARADEDAPVVRIPNGVSHQVLQ